jgi:hypothetical protein
MEPTMVQLSCTGGNERNFLAFPQQSSSTWSKTMAYQQEMEERRRDMLGYTRGDERLGVTAALVLGIVALVTLGALVLTYPGGSPDRVQMTENMQTTEQAPSIPPTTPQKEPN